jgi:hypothetical protein
MYALVHFCSEISSLDISNRARLISKSSRHVARATSPALLALGRVGMPPYRPYTHAEAVPRPMVHAPRTLAPARDVCGSPGQATRRLRTGHAAPPLASDRRTSPPTPSLYLVHTAASLTLARKKRRNRLAPAIQASPPSSSRVNVEPRRGRHCRRR